MKNPLPINIRCVCIEEYVKMQELHEWYRKQKSEGEILSIYTGADESLRGRYAAVDVLLDKFVGKFQKASDGGADAMGNLPLPEKPLDLDEARAIGSAYAEQEEKLVGCEEPVPDQVWKEGKEDYSFRPEPAQGAPAVEPKPEITLTDVLTAMAEELDPMEAIKTEAEGEPDGDGQDYNTTCAG